MCPILSQKKQNIKHTRKWHNNMDTQSKSSSAKDSSKTSTASVKTKSSKKENSSSTERISPVTGKAVRKYVKRTGGKIEEVKPVSPPTDFKKKEAPTEKAPAPTVEKTKEGTKVVVDEKELVRLQNIEKIVIELIKGADDQKKYLGYGKSPRLQDTHEAQEGPGVKRLRKLVNLEPKAKDDTAPGKDVPF